MDRNKIVNAETKRGSKYKNLLQNTFVLGIGVFASKFLVFLMMPLYTGILSPGEYSTADLISQTANLIIPLACVGISDGIFRFAMDSDRDRRTVFSSGFFVLLVSSVIFGLLSPLIGLVEYFNSYSLLIAAYVISANIHSVCAQYLRACNRTKLFALQGIINTVLVIVFNVLLLVVFDMRVEGYVLSVILADLVTSIVLLFACGLFKDLKPRFVDFGLVKGLLKYSIPMIPATIFWWITSVSDRYMVTYFSGDEINGLYTAAYKIPTLLSLVSTVFMEAWQYSAVSENENDKENAKTFFGEVFEHYQAIMFVAASAMVALSQIFIMLLCADSYFDAWKYVPVLTLSAVFSGFTAFLGSIYLVKKKSSLTFLTSMAGALVNIVLNFLMIPWIGAQGAAVATLASYILVFGIRAANTRRYVPFSLHLGRMTVNLAIVSLQTILILCMPKYLWITQPLCIIAVVAVNFRVLWQAISRLLGALLRKTKKQ